MSADQAVLPYFLKVLLNSDWPASDLMYAHPMSRMFVGDCKAPRAIYRLQ